MAYEVTIRCSVRRGNPLEKKRCHSDAQARMSAPTEERATSREAVYAVEMTAKDMGWKRVRRSCRPAAWTCPACQSD